MRHGALYRPSPLYNACSFCRGLRGARPGVRRTIGVEKTIALLKAIELLSFKVPRLNHLVYGGEHLTFAAENFFLNNNDRPCNMYTIFASFDINDQYVFHEQTSFLIIRYATRALKMWLLNEICIYVVFNWLEIDCDPLVILFLFNLFHFPAAR